MIPRKEESEEQCMGNWKKVGHYNNCDCYGSYNNACMAQFVLTKKREPSCYAFYYCS